MRSVLALSALAAAVMLSASPAAAVTILDVDVNEGCGKTTCFNEQGRFTQTWSAKDAAGPMTIGQILMDRGILGSLDGSTFRLSFTLDGKEIGAWGSYMMAGIAGDELTFTGQNFTWNPEDGDLMLVLEIAKPKGGGIGFSSNIVGPGDGKPGDTEHGDIGGPLPGGPSPAPEPATWALMIGGFGLAGAVLRRRRFLAA